MKTRMILARHVMEERMNCMENPQKKTWSRLKGPKMMRSKIVIMADNI